ncbi:MAG: thiol-disulfide oxidoreductase DCC family protein, partial [Bacteroidia bacterium]
MKSESPVVFFDGLCNLCNGAVQFAIKRDPKAVFKFASLQSDYAQHHLTAFKINLEQAKSMVLLENGRVYERSTAALRVARHLGGWWPL